MSDKGSADYAFVLCRLRSRKDVYALENALCGKTNVYTTGVTLPFDDDVIRRATTMFGSRWAGLQVEPRDVAKTAAEREMTEWEVRQTLSLVEMYIRNDGTDAYFEIFADNILVSLPLSHKTPRLEPALHRMWEYLDLFESELGCVTFDLQYRRVLDLAQDFESVKSKYELMAGRSGENGKGSRWWPW